MAVATCLAQCLRHHYFLAHERVMYTIRITCICKPSKKYAFAIAVDVQSMSQHGVHTVHIVCMLCLWPFVQLHVQVRVPHSLVAVTDFVSGGEDTAVEVPVGEVLRLAADFVSRDGEFMSGDGDLLSRDSQF